MLRNLKDQHLERILQAGSPNLLAYLYVWQNPSKFKDWLILPESNFCVLIAKLQPCCQQQIAIAADRHADGYGPGENVYRALATLCRQVLPDGADDKELFNSLIRRVETDIDLNRLASDAWQLDHPVAYKIKKFMPLLHAYRILHPVIKKNLVPGVTRDDERLIRCHCNTLCNPDPNFVAIRERLLSQMTPVCTLVEGGGHTTTVLANKPHYSYLIKRISTIRNVALAEPAICAFSLIAYMPRAKEVHWSHDQNPSNRQLQRIKIDSDGTYDPIEADIPNYPINQKKGFHVSFVNGIYTLSFQFNYHISS